MRFFSYMAFPILLLIKDGVEATPSNSSSSTLSLSALSYSTLLQFSTADPDSTSSPPLSPVSVGQSLSAMASLVLAITLPAPPNLLPSGLPTSAVGGVIETITVTKTAEASTVTMTVSFFLPPETVTNTIIITVIPPTSSSVLPASSLLLPSLTAITTSSSSSLTSTTASPSPLVSLSPSAIPIPSSLLPLPPPATPLSSLISSSPSTATATSSPFVLPTTTLSSSSSLSLPSPIAATSYPVSAPSSPTQLPGLDGLAVWTLPTHLTDLDPFKITSPGTHKNLKIVTGMPPKASASPNARVSSAKASSNENDDNSSQKHQSLPPLTTWDSKSTSLQLLYPANSINPGQKPQGGAEFYASPLDISTARNVSMRFSVYFPQGFDWVLAGKLPGIYGGHTGCSGGNAALDCFSTRLMWRQDGVGELYLYAAKDKQTKALCSDPRSVCDAAYGFSIGRGSFTWAAGAWTTVTQTVVLNTPGKQDGAFTLNVNGKTVIDKTQVFYRDVLWPDKGKTSSSAPNRPTVSTSLRAPPAITSSPERPTMTKVPTTTTSPDPLGDILGPLLSEIGRLIRRGGAQTASPTHMPISPATLVVSAALASTNAQTEGGMATPKTVPVDRAASPTPTSQLLPAADRRLPPRIDAEYTGGDYDHEDNDGDDRSDEGDSNDADPFAVQSLPQREGTSIGFIGIFFSTFFGGHDDKYATPRDQYVWFKDFAMSYNA